MINYSLHLQRIENLEKLQSFLKHFSFFINRLNKVTNDISDVIPEYVENYNMLKNTCISVYVDDNNTHLKITSVSNCDQYSTLVLKPTSVNLNEFDDDVLRICQYIDGEIYKIKKEIVDIIYGAENNIKLVKDVINLCLSNLQPTYKHISADIKKIFQLFFEAAPYIYYYNEQSKEIVLRFGKLNDNSFLIVYSFKLIENEDGSIDISDMKKHLSYFLTVIFTLPY